MADRNYRNHSTQGRPDPYDALRSAFDDPADSHAAEDLSHTRRVSAVRPASPEQRADKRGASRLPVRRGVRRRGGDGADRKKAPLSPAQRMIRKRILILAGLIALLAAVLLSVYAVFCIRDVLAIGVEEDSVRVEIPEGATTGQIIDILHDNDLIQNTVFCKLFAKLREYEDNYVGGVYTVDTNIGLEEMLYLFKAKPKTAEEKEVTIPEGWTLDQIVERLNEMGVCTSEELYDTIANTDFTNYPFIAALSEQDQTGRYYLLEGYLFPDTYRFYADSNPNDVIKKFLDRYEEMIATLDINRAQELGYTWDEIMVIASIIEREAGSVEQMADVSAVIHNRLKNPVEYPLLQMDSTSYYYYNYIEPKLTDDGQKSLYASAYDTYNGSCLGLPKGPICNPSINAIEAALYPTENSPYYYFYHDSNGKMWLAKTDQEHVQNQVEANRGDSNG